MEVALFQGPTTVEASDNALEKSGNVAAATSVRIRPVPQITRTRSTSGCRIFENSQLAAEATPEEAELSELVRRIER